MLMDLVLLQFFRISWVIHCVDNEKGNVDKVAENARDAERFKLDHRVRKVYGRTNATN